MRSLQIGTDRVLLAMVLILRGGLSAEDRDAVFADANGRIRANLPGVAYLYLLPSPGGL